MVFDPSIGLCNWKFAVPECNVPYTFNEDERDEAQDDDKLIVLPDNGAARIPVLFGRSFMIFGLIASLQVCCFWQ